MIVVDKCFYRRLVLIAGNENVSAKDRIDAEAASSCEVALAITKLAFEGPIMIRHFIGKGVLDKVYDFIKPFDAAEAELIDHRYYYCNNNDDIIGDGRPSAAATAATISELLSPQFHLIAI
jgi:hypothetical protein